MALMMATLSAAVQPWLASTRSLISGPTASRMAAMRATSAAPSLPTLTFRMWKPRATASKLSRTISWVGFTEMVMSVSKAGLAPPKSW